MVGINSLLLNVTMFGIYILVILRHYSMVPVGIVAPAYGGNWKFLTYVNLVNIIARIFLFVGLRYTN